MSFRWWEKGGRDYPANRRGVYKGDGKPLEALGLSDPNRGRFK